MKGSKKIGTIGNYYGDLRIYAKGPKFYWYIENYDDDNPEEIPEYLYETLVRYENERHKQTPD